MSLGDSFSESERGVFSNNTINSGKYLGETTLRAGLTLNMRNSKKAPALQLKGGLKHSFLTENESFTETSSWGSTNNPHTNVIGSTNGHYLGIGYEIPGKGNTPFSIQYEYRNDFNNKFVGHTIFANWGIKLE